MSGGQALTGAPARRGLAGAVAASLLLHAGVGLGVLLTGLRAPSPPEIKPLEPIEVELAAPVSPSVPTAAPSEAAARLPESLAAPRQKSALPTAPVPEAGTPAEIEASPEPRPPPPPSPAETAPPTTAAPPALDVPQRAAAPAGAAPVSPRERNAYVAELMAWLGRFKRYPIEARRARVEGVVVVRFAVDDGGRVTSAEIARSSGRPSLDQAALDMFARASPVPKPPPAFLRDGRAVMTLPIEFSLFTR